MLSLKRDHQLIEYAATMLLIEVIDAICELELTAL